MKMKDSTELYISISLIALILISLDYIPIK
jgi:hypothetical protein